jgi:uncharacterized protein (TIGR02246 family)
MSESRSDRLDRLEDVLAIQNLKAQYTDRCDDSYDPDGIAKLFAPDATWESTGFGVHEGREAIRAFMAGVSANITWALHCVSNPSIDVAPDGLSATGSWYLFTPCTMTGEDGRSDAVILTGKYRDQFVKLDGQWFFSDMRCHLFQVSNLDQGWVTQPFRQ